MPGLDAPPPARVAPARHPLPRPLPRWRSPPRHRHGHRSGSPSPTRPTCACARRASEAHAQGVSGATVTLAVVAALVMGSIAGVAGGFLGGQLRLADRPRRPRPRRSPSFLRPPRSPSCAAAASRCRSIVNIDVSSGEATGREKGLPNTHPSVPMKGNGSGVAFKKVAGYRDVHPDQQPRR